MNEIPDNVRQILISDRVYTTKDAAIVLDFLLMHREQGTLLNALDIPEVDQWLTQRAGKRDLHKVFPLTEWSKSHSCVCHACTQERNKNERER